MQVQQQNRAKMEMGDLNFQKAIFLQRENQKLKDQLLMLADQNDTLKDTNKKLQENQRFFIDLVNKYQRELNIVKKSMPTLSAKKSQRNPKIINSAISLKTKEAQVSRIKVENKKNIIELGQQIKKQQQSVDPLTIGTIVSLRTKILQLKKQLYQTSLEMGELLKQRNQLMNAIETKEAQDQNHRNNYQYNPAEKNQIKHLHRKISKLKRQANFAQRRQQKLRRIVNKLSQRGISDIEGFKEWISNKEQEEKNMNIQGQQIFNQ